jgi:YVTN family beta-propeller protein
VLYECLAGEPPYRGESLMGVLYGHVSAPIPSLHEHRPELPEEIDRVMARALAKQPEDRYGSCRELVDEARSALDLGGEPAPTATFTRKRLLLAAGGALAVAAAATVPAVLLTRNGGATGPLVIEPRSVVRIDPAGNQPVAVVRGQYGPVAVGEGAVWIANTTDGTVSRIDPGTAAVTRTVSTRGAPLGIAVGEGTVWAWSSFEGEAKLTEIDPATGRVRFVQGLGYPDPAGGAVGFGSLWLSVNDLGGQGALLRIDPQRIVAITSLPGKPGAVAAGEGAVWVGGAAIHQAPPQDIWRIDPATSELVETIDLGGDEYVPVAVGEGAVWLWGDRAVASLDPVTRQIAEEIELGIKLYAVAVGAGSVWATGYDVPTVLRIDPAISAVVAEIDMTEYGDVGYTGPIAVGAEGVWVSIFG